MKATIAGAGDGSPSPAFDRADTRLRGRRLYVGWAVWFCLLLIAGALFISGITARFQDLTAPGRENSPFQYRADMYLSLKRSPQGDIILSPSSVGPAVTAGILEGDVLVAVDGVPVSRDMPLAQVLPDGVLGTVVQLDVRRGTRPSHAYTLIRGGAQMRPFAPLGLVWNRIWFLNLGFDLVLALVSVGIAGLVFIRKRDDWMALLVSIALVMALFGTAISQPVSILANAHIDWQPAFDSWYALAFGSFLLFLYVFPDGQFRPRWTKRLIGLWTIWMVAALVIPKLYPWQMSPWLYSLSILGWLSSGVVAQVYRYRRFSDTTQRQQTKWVVLGAALAVTGLLLQFLYFIFGNVLFGSGALYDALVYPLARLLEVSFLVSIAIAILRYRLWDIDIILNRALVYGALTLSVVALYVLIVVSLGALLQATGNFLISLVATALVAIIFQPLRDRLQRGVNRLMYGERDDPYGVVSRLARRLETTIAPEAVLPSTVETVAQALKLPYAAIMLKQGEAFEVAAIYGTTPTANGPPQDGKQLVMPLVHQGETVGQLILAPRARGEDFAPPDLKLLQELALHAGTAVHAVRLTADLQESRERLVTAREEERRRLRRDLHDGLGPSLASLTLQLDAARRLLTRDPVAADALLVDLKTQTQTAVTDIRRLVYDLRPPALDDLGLVPALRQEAAQYSQGNGLVVSVEAPGHLPALPAAVEVAVYRIALEALTNVVRYSHARHCTVRLTLSRLLQLEIIDDGVGIPAERRAGVGTSSMRERATELGGTFTIESSAGKGTRVVACLPLPQV